LGELCEAVSGDKDYCSSQQQAGAESAASVHGWDSGTGGKGWREVWQSAGTGWLLISD
jgi:hypothetical protein